MENRDILERMIQIREKREQEIHNENNKEENINNVINDVKYLGKIRYLEEINGQKIETEKDIFVVIEDDDGKISYIYYDENLENVAFENDMFDEILPGKDFMDKDESFLKEISEMDKDGKSLSEIQEQVEKIEKVAKALGIDPEQIENIDELDLDQLLEEKEREEDSEVDELTKEEVLKLDIKETTNLSENIKGTTLGNKLGVSNMELPDGTKLTDGEKLARVSTSSLDKYTQTNTSMQDSFVIIRSNGEAVPVGEDILKPDSRSGVNSTREDLTINNDGSVRREVNTSSYVIVNGNGREFIKVGNDEQFGKEIKYSQWSDEKGEYVDTELKTSRDIMINDDTRQYLKDRNEGVREATDTIERAEHHEEQGEKETDVTLVDNNPDNDSHYHVDENDYIPNTNTTWREFANICGYRGADSIERAQEKFEKAVSENSELNNKEIIEEVEEEMNEDYRNTEEQRR